MWSGLFFNTTSTLSEGDKKLDQSNNASEECAKGNSSNGEIKEQEDLKKCGTIKDEAKDDTAKKRKKRHRYKPAQQVQPHGTCINAPDGYINGDSITLNGRTNDDYVLSVLRIMTKEEWRKYYLYIFNFKYY